MQLSDSIGALAPTWVQVARFLRIVYDYAGECTWCRKRLTTQRLDFDGRLMPNWRSEKIGKLLVNVSSH
jgi:hypothetical protein